MLDKRKITNKERGTNMLWKAEKLITFPADIITLLFLSGVLFFVKVNNFVNYVSSMNKI